MGCLLPLGLVLAVATALSPASAQPVLPTLGAIRWDAWLGGVVTNEVTLALTPPQYHFRLPWFAQVLDPGEVRIVGGTQEIMDREIADAADAGLDYWAFVVYRHGDQMSRGLELYLSSAQRPRLRFCLILHNNLGVPEADWPAERDRVVKLLQEPGYMTVCEGRPLVYMFTPPHPGRLSELQSAVVAIGLKPYYVYMGWNPPQDWQTAQTLGFDAISAYACGGQGTYAQLTERVERVLWEAAGKPGIPLVPLATTGWDRRPRIDRPPPWEANNKSTAWVETATPEQIAAHVKRTIEWTGQHPAITPANTVIIYAWNEHDEGGWLCPTWRADGQPDEGRLQALQGMLRGLREPQ